MGSILNGWWAWLTVFFATMVLAVAVVSPFEEDGSIAGGIFLGTFGAMAVAGLVIRLSNPQAAAWLVSIGVGFPGAAFFWALLIPTTLAAIIVIGGVATGEIAFRSREPSPAG